MSKTDKEAQRVAVAHSRGERVRKRVMEATEANKEDTWYSGYRTALRDYAWWKNGVQYVGCGVKTLANALLDVQKK